MLEFLEKKETKIAAIAIAVVLFIVLLIMLFQKNTVEQTQKTLEHEAGRELVMETKDFFKAEDEILDEMTIDVSKVNTNKAGEYKATATYKNKKYTIDVNVVDTTAPKVELTDRVVFTNDTAKTNAGIEEILASVTEASEYTAKLIRFEKIDVLHTMDSFAVSKLETSVHDFRTKEDALAVGTEEVPTQPGIYRSVLEVADVHGNASYNEIYVILDTTGAVINDVADMTVTVSADRLNDKPALDMTLYKGYDEVDGTLTSENLSIELLSKDEAKHEWTVLVSYTDRAGNESKSEFLITAVEEKQQTVVNNNQKPGNGTGNENTGNSANQNSNNVTDTNTGNNQGSTSNISGNKPGGNGNTGNMGTGNSNTEYDPRDTNKDGEVSGDEEARYITPEKQACIDAGYGVVVEMDGGEWYAVLMKDIDHTINGKDGGDILYDYLEEKGLRASQISGGIINSDNEWYWFTARDIYELPDDGFNLEDGDWEFVD